MNVSKFKLAWRYGSPHHLACESSRNGCPAASRRPNKTLAIGRRRADTSVIMEANSTPAPAPRADGDEHVQGDGKVIPFRPRRTPATGRDVPEVDANTAAPEDLAKYERGDEDDDYRHRMVMNLAALAVTIILATAGAWLAITIGDMRKNQDCYLSGRRNCTPIDVPSLQPKEQPR
jgi:hypothetical protein